jgi:phosphoglycerate dehydrogenase-like enzyme
MRIVTLIAPTFRAKIDGVVVHGVEALRRELPGADVLVLAPRFGEMLRDVWPLPASVRWVHALGAGVEKLPFDLLRQTDVVITNSRGVYADALAEWVFAGMLWFAKRLHERRTEWKTTLVERLEGATIGIIGYGSTGRAVAERARAFKMNVLTSSRTGGGLLDDVIEKSDYLVLATPLTRDTRGMITAERIGKMRSHAVLINVGRGEVVDEAALIDALQSKRIRGAALDVFEKEPLPPDSPLWHLDNVLLSPHSADQTADSHERAVAFFTANLDRFKRGEPLENVVDKRAGY